MQNFTEPFRLNHREKCCGANRVSPRVGVKRLMFPVFIRVDYDFTKVTNVALLGSNPRVFKSLSVLHKSPAIETTPLQRHRQRQGPHT